MKICDNCGHANFKFEIKDKKSICGSCGLVMSETPQCKPTRKNNCSGQPIQGETKKLYDDVTINEEK